MGFEFVPSALISDKPLIFRQKYGNRKTSRKLGLMVSARIVYTQANTHKHIPICVQICTNTHMCMYTGVSGEKSIFWEVIVSVILRKNCVCTYVLFRTVSEIELFHVIASLRKVKMHSDEQHAMSSHELQRALMLKVEFSKIYYTR
jgi:hypothetical protein